MILMPVPAVLTVSLGRSLPFAGLHELVNDRLKIVLGADRNLLRSVIDPSSFHLEMTSDGIVAVFPPPAQIQQSLIDPRGRAVRHSTEAQDLEVAATSVDQVVRASAEFHREVTHVVHSAHSPQAELDLLERVYDMSATPSLKLLRSSGESVMATTQMDVHEFARPATRRQFHDCEILRAVVTVVRWPKENGRLAVSVEKLNKPHACSQQLLEAQEWRTYYEPGDRRILLAAALSWLQGSAIEVVAHVNISATTRRPISLDLVSVENADVLVSAAQETLRNQGRPSSQP